MITGNGKQRIVQESIITKIKLRNVHRLKFSAWR